MTGIVNLSKHLYRENPDVLISFTHYANLVAGLTRICGLAKRVVVSNRNPHFSYPRLARYADRLLAKLGAYDVVTHVSQSVRESFRYLDQSSLRLPQFVIHNSVEEMDPAEPPASPTTPYFLSVGRLVPQKNHALLIDALAESGSSVKLVIVGTGPLEHQLKERIRSRGLEDQIELAGELPHQKVISLLLGAKAFLMPSLYEGMSNALIEAVASGIWPVVSDVPAQVEAITLAGGRFGDALPLDTAHWAEALIRLGNGHTITQEFSSLPARSKGLLPHGSVH